MSQYANPIFFLYLLVFGIAVSACIYRRLLYSSDVAEDEPEDLEERTSHNFPFGDYFVLAALALAFGVVAVGALISIGLLALARFMP